MVTNIKPIRSPEGMKNLIDYLASEQGHNDNSVRNEIMFSNAIVQEDPQSIKAKLIDEWEATKSERNNIPGYSIMFSSSKNELDPDEPQSVSIMMDCISETMEKAYPDRTFVAYIQKDGKGGCLHGHVAVLNVNSRGKAFKSGTNNHFYLKPISDEVCSEVLERNGSHFDYGKQDDKTTKTVLRTREWNKEHPEEQKFILSDAIKDGVSRACLEATSLEDFKRRLAHEHITITRAGVSKGANYYTYEYDASAVPVGVEVPKRFKMRSDKLGSNYAPDHIIEEIQRNSIQMQMQAPPVEYELINEEAERAKERRQDAEILSDWEIDKEPEPIRVPEKIPEPVTPPPQENKTPYKEPQVQHKRKISQAERDIMYKNALYEDITQTQPQYSGVSL